MLTEIAKYTTREHVKVVWDCLEARMNRILSNEDGDCDLVDGQLSLLVQLTNVWTEWKTKRLIFNPVQLYKVFVINVFIHVYNNYILLI